MPVASITEALRGQIPGVNVSGGSVRPGSMPSLSIRQQFNWGKDGGGTNPLIIIDDVIQVDPQTGLSSLDRFNQLDLSEVESITVLRDASAAIYGSRASQGAVVVKTKRGKAGPPRISYNGKFETNNAVSHGKVMNAREFGTYANRFGKALGWTVDQLFSDAELATMDSLNYDWLANDWRAANAMQHSLDVSGGSERATYFAGGSYYTQERILVLRISAGGLTGRALISGYSMVCVWVQLLQLLILILKSHLPKLTLPTVMLVVAVMSKMITAFCCICLNIFHGYTILMG
ncbi:TonB-dependent receptor plug domain-containing protein [Niabella sp. W65]|nr:TonB-dependent receptor plug domain-containing protein [Niabella sp. W65]MCH7365642.1 TonB-dependent receptor plug domain-containing protein [Niabella sp. W65]ULT41417.1 TonB-dependent receptor plug domain-containing protein [Niabella sp. I65]